MAHWHEFEIEICKVIEMELLGSNAPAVICFLSINLNSIESYRQAMGDNDELTMTEIVTASGENWKVHLAYSDFKKIMKHI